MSLNQRAIARALGRSPSTISREFARNGAHRRNYKAQRAQKCYAQARRASRRTTSLSHLPLRRYLFDKLTEGWSPEQVAGRFEVVRDVLNGHRVNRNVVGLAAFAVDLEGRHDSPALIIGDVQTAELLTAQAVVQKRGDDGAVALSL